MTEIETGAREHRVWLWYLDRGDGEASNGAFYETPGLFMSAGFLALRSIRTDGRRRTLFSTRRWRRNGEWF